MNLEMSHIPLNLKKSEIVYDVYVRISNHPKNLERIVKYNAIQEPENNLLQCARIFK